MKVLAFDFSKFESQIIPAFKEGETNSLIKNEIEFLIKDSEILLRPNESNNAYKHLFHGLKTVIATFDDLLLSSNLGKKFAVLNGQIDYVDKLFYLPSRKHWGYEDLCVLFEYITIKHCAKYYLNLGKKYSLKDFIPSYDNEMLSKLDTGCNFFQHSDGGFGEGITGWLNEAETILLFDSIEKININSLKANQSEIFIDEFIKLVELAMKENLGILAGRDLRLNVPNRPGILKLKLNNHISGDACSNFDGEIVYNSTYK